MELDKNYLKQWKDRIKKFNIEQAIGLWCLEAGIDGMHPAQYPSAIYAHRVLDGNAYFWLYQQNSQLLRYMFYIILEQHMIEGLTSPNIFIRELCKIYQQEYAEKAKHYGV